MKRTGKTILVKLLNIKDVQEGDHHKYLGVEESLVIDDTLNKEKIIKEYKYRICKIWSSELNSLNKTIAHYDNGSYTMDKERNTRPGYCDTKTLDHERIIPQSK